MVKIEILKDIFEHPRRSSPFSERAFTSTNSCRYNLPFFARREKMVELLSAEIMLALARWIKLKGKKAFPSMIFQNPCESFASSAYIRLDVETLIVFVCRCTYGIQEKGKIPFSRHSALPHNKWNQWEKTSFSFLHLGISKLTHNILARQNVKNVLWHLNAMEKNESCSLKIQLSSC